MRIQANPFYFVAALAFLAISAADVPSNEAVDENVPGADQEKKDVKVQIPGFYKLETDPNNEDFKKYLTVMGYPEELQKNFTETRKVMAAVRMFNGSHVLIRRISPTDRNTLIFISGKEFETVLFDGRRVLNTVTMDKEKNTIHRIIKMEGFTAVIDSMFNKEGFRITMRAKDALATLQFSRWGSYYHGSMDDPPKKDA